MNASSPTTVPTLVEDSAQPSYATPDVGILDAIFSMAIAHDIRCQRAAHAFDRGLEPEGAKRHMPVQEVTIEGKSLDDFEVELRQEIVKLCATIAEASVRRVPPLRPFARRMMETGMIFELEPDELEAFLRPIFAESRIGDRFEVRERWHVYNTTVSPE